MSKARFHDMKGHAIACSGRDVDKTEILDVGSNMLKTAMECMETCTVTGSKLSLHGNFNRSQDLGEVGHKEEDEQTNWEIRSTAFVFWWFS
eukprot:6196085-Pleurochrysis_carterae.AAC.1